MRTYITRMLVFPFIFFFFFIIISFYLFLFICFSFSVFSNIQFLSVYTRFVADAAALRCAVLCTCSVCICVWLCAVDSKRLSREQATHILYTDKKNKFTLQHVALKHPTTKSNGVMSRRYHVHYYAVRNIEAIIGIFFYSKTRHI